MKAFWKQAPEDGHRGVLATAGTSATGIAMLGVARTFGAPIVSMVRDAAGKAELTALGAENVLVQADPSSEAELAAMVESQSATAVFEGVGGEIVTRIAPSLAYGSTIYSYGCLGGAAPISLHASLLFTKNLTIRNFSNFGSPTVRDPNRLRAALDDLSEIIAMPHFRRKRGRTFAFDEIADAMEYSDANGGKPILSPG